MERIEKIVAVALNITRTDAKKIIGKGQISVNGTAIKQVGAKFNPDVDQVRCDGKSIFYKEFIYILQNKPLGVVSSTDEHDGETVLSILPPALCRNGLFPAGRLDKYSEGMMIITDDGAFAHRILSPNSHVPKTYYVEVDNPAINSDMVSLFAKGVYLGDNQYSSPATLEISTETSGYITIHEGIYHQVRRMFDQNGAKVTRLIRVKIGNLEMDSSLPQGESRLLTEEEKNALQCK